jgi:CRP-like cAMP-binding protein
MAKMDKRQAEAFLRSMTWLAESPADFQDQVLAKCDMLRFRRSDLIYDAGDEASGLFGVVEGHLEVHLPTPGVAATPSYIGGPGSWFGDIAAVTGQRRKIAIVAGSDCQLLRLPRLEIVRMTASDPIVWRYFSLPAGAQLRQGDERRIGAEAGRSGETGRLHAAHPQRGGPGRDRDCRLPKVNSSLKALEGRGHIRRRYGSLSSGAKCNPRRH